MKLKKIFVAKNLSNTFFLICRLKIEIKSFEKYFKFAQLNVSTKICEINCEGVSDIFSDLSMAENISLLEKFFIDARLDTTESWILQSTAKRHQPKY